jgi:phosphate transport system substrate-binding protein
MNKNDNIKILNINNISPTIENIQNNSYPFTTNIYMVSTKNSSENTQKLIDWFVSEQGQELIKDVGYVPIYDTK